MVSTKTKKNLKKGRYIFIAIFLTIIIFAFFDYLVHLTSEEYSVPSYYFKNKIIYGTLWGILFYAILNIWKTNIALKSFIFSLLISTVLQARYFYEGYSLEFVIEFLFFHFFILWIVSYIIFKIFKDKI